MYETRWEYDFFIELLTSGSSLDRARWRLLVISLDDRDAGLDSVLHHWSVERGGGAVAEELAVERSAGRSPRGAPLIQKCFFFHLFPQQECGHSSNKNMWIEEAKIIKDQDFTSKSGFFPLFDLWSGKLIDVAGLIPLDVWWIYRWDMMGSYTDLQLSGALPARLMLILVDGKGLEEGTPGEMK